MKILSKIKALKKITKDQAKDAFRLAIQSAIAGASCYYLMTLFNIPERFLGVLSAVLIIEPSIGNTFHQAKGRLLSTLVGITIGFVIVALIPWELGVILSLIISLFIINGISSFKPEWRYGVVAAVALALGTQSDTFEMSLDRLIAIGFGVLVGIIATLVIWPDTSENRALKFVRKALRNTQNRFKIEFGNTRDDDNKSTSKTNDNFSTNISKAKNIADSIAFNDNRKIIELISNTERLFNSITIIQRIAEKSDSGISDGAAGIENDSEKVTKKACHIIEKFTSNNKVEESEIREFSDLIETTQNNINVEIEDRELLKLRHTFVFGLNEIEDSIKRIHESLDTV